jgi:hypothetical protein
MRDYLNRLVQEQKEEIQRGRKKERIYSLLGLGFMSLALGFGGYLGWENSSRKMDQAILDDAKKAMYTVTVQDRDDPAAFIDNCAEKLGVRPEIIGKDIIRQSLEIDEPIDFSNLPAGKQIPFYKECAQK